MSVRVAINGFGRIGRVFLRAAVEREAPIDIVAVNDVGDPTGMAMLLRHDSVYGPYPGRVAERDGELMAGDVTIPIFREPDPRDLPWGELEVDVVLESTGHFPQAGAGSAPSRCGGRRWSSSRTGHRS